MSEADSLQPALQADGRVFVFGAGGKRQQWDCPVVWCKPPFGNESTVQLLNKVKTEFPCHSLSCWAKLQRSLGLNSNPPLRNWLQDLDTFIDPEPFFIGYGLHLCKRCKEKIDSLFKRNARGHRRGQLHQHKFLMQISCIRTRLITDRAV